MRRLALSALVVAGLSVAALAVGDVPTRYSGSFPSDGIRTGITGTFTGKTLTLRYTSAEMKKGQYGRSFSGSCTSTSAASTCRGRVTITGTTFGAPAVVTVGWSAGRPVSLSILK